VRVIQPVVVGAPDLLWASTLGDRALPDLTAAERVRQETIHELRTTEITFVAFLRELEAVRSRRVGGTCVDGSGGLRTCVRAR
jgi:hypothetical protein